MTDSETISAPVRGRSTARGGLDPRYAILHADRVRSIRSEFPSLRLIYLIRNPVDRAWSSALIALRRVQITLDEASDRSFVDHFRSRGSLGDYLGTDLG